VQCPGQIVGGAERDDPERQFGADQSLDHSVQGAVSSGDDHPVDCAKVSTDELAYGARLTQLTRNDLQA
jgi:hypothetical protein